MKKWAIFIIDQFESAEWPHLAEMEKGRSISLIFGKVSKTLPEY